jgi:receptor protein-tyrosine kinase
MQTQADILQQDAMLSEVARKLRLAQLPEFDGPGGVLRTLHKNISVAPLRNSRVLQIGCDAANPQLAADIANALAGTFIDRGVEARRRSARETYDSLQPALEKLKRAALMGQDPAGKLAGKRGSSTDAEANQHLYDSMRQRVNEAWIASMVDQSNVRWVSAAAPASRPYKPNIPLNLAIGAAAGLLFGIAWIMLNEQNRSVLRNPDEAGFYLTLRELGVIPHAAGKRSLIVVRNSEDASTQEPVAVALTPGLSESFRATAASILSTRCGGGHPRILVVTSSQPNEGKTTVVSNLGIALAEVGNKVLMIDGDLRRPRLHQIFDLANSWGLSDVLRERNAIDELPLETLTRKTSLPHLYLLPSGASTDNIFGLLHSGRMSSLLPRFREEFDYVLVDAPPCLEFADARIMAQYAEQLVLVVRANHTDRRAAQTAVQRFRLDGVPVMGFILNRCEPDSGVPTYSRIWTPRHQAVS